jgi:hypothetical protein
VIQGETELKQMRLEGRAPSLLWIDLDSIHIPSAEHLRIDSTEPLSSLDLRSLQGLVVNISGCHPERVRAIGKACEEVGARRVLTNTHQQQPDGRFEVVEVTDTEGFFTWKK